MFLSSLFLFLISVNAKYSDWERRFEEDLNASYLIDENTQIEDVVKEKVAEYTLSNENVENLQLKPKEIGYIIFNTLSEYNSGGFSFSRLHIEPSRSLWNICTEISFKKNTLSPWICVDLNKDNIQTAQLYISDVRVGPFSISKWGNILDKVNSGLASSLLTVNENGFSGRYFENIELLDDSVVIKGSQY